MPRLVGSNAPLVRGVSLIGAAVLLGLLGLLLSVGTGLFAFLAALVGVGLGWWVALRPSENEPATETLATDTRRMLLDAVPDAALCVVDSQITLANAAAVALLVAGSEQQLLGRRVSSLFPESERTRTGNSSRWFRVEATNPTDVSLLTLDGKRVEVSLFVTPLRGTVANETLWLLRDLRPAREAEARLRESTRLIASVAETVPDLLYVYDLDNHCNIYANRKFGSLLGYSDDEVDRLGDDFLSHTLHHDDLSPVREHARLIATLPLGASATLEYRVRGKDSRWHWVESRERIFQCHDDGTPHLVLGMAQDITRRKEVADALRRSEERFRELAETIPCCFWVANPVTGRIEYVSPAFQTLYQRSPEILSEGGIARFVQDIHPDDREPFLANLKLVAEHGEGRQDYRYIRPSGQTNWMRDNAFAIRGSSGKILRFVGYTEDITAHKEAERALQQRMDQANLMAEVALALTRSDGLQTILQSCTDAIVKFTGAAFARIWTVDGSGTLLELQASSGEYTRLDGAYSRLRVGQRKVGRIASERRPHFTNDVTNDSEIGDPQWAQREGMVAFAGHPLVIDDTPIGVVALFARQLLPESTRNTLATLADAIALGIVRKRVELERDQLVALSPDPVASCDFQGVIRTANPACLQLLGCTREQLVGRTMLDFLADDDRAAAVSDLARVRSSDQAVVSEHRWRPLDGSPLRWIAWSAIRSRELGVIFGMGRDMSQLKSDQVRLAQALDVAEAANRAKSAFLSRMSHELRTPMNSIIGFAQLLAPSELDSDQQESVDHILKAGKHLLRLINDILDLSRVESGRLSVELLPLELEGAIGEAVDLVGPLAVSRRVEVITLPGAETAWVVADSRRLVQALLNLLSNAVKYNRDGGRVLVRTRREAESWRVEVEDTGPGIPVEQLPRLFQAFERLDAGKGAIEGTGLGLAVARSVIEAMNGQIGVDSEAGRGATFWIALPAAEPSDPTAHRPGSVQGVPPAATRGLVLQIEDNEANRRLIEQVVCLRPGVTLISAGTAERGLDLITIQAPDLIFLDVHLGESDGEAILKQLRSAPETASVPVVVLSADATAPTIERMLAAGATAYLTKPLDVQQLLSTLDGHLSLTESRAP